LKPGADTESLSEANLVVTELPNVAREMLSFLEERVGERVCPAMSRRAIPAYPITPVDIGIRP
jgi:hypothetical protein